MISTVKNIWRLAAPDGPWRRYDFFLQPDQVSQLPWFARALLKTAKFGAAAPDGQFRQPGDRSAFVAGPSYIDFGPVSVHPS